MANICGWKEIVHYKTLIFYKISKQPANHYDLGNVVSVHIMFMCKGYGDMGDKKKINFSKKMSKFRTTVSKGIE